MRNTFNDKLLQCLQGNLWYRQGLTPSYPQGSIWELISNNVTRVSVGPLDQVGLTTTYLFPLCWGVFEQGTELLVAYYLNCWALALSRCGS